MNESNQGANRQLEEDLRRRQSNILPPDLISNDRFVDDALWNGPARESRIQRAGSMVIGGAITLGALAVASMSYQRHSVFGLAIMVILGAGGIRIIYKSLRGRSRTAT